MTITGRKAISGRETAVDIETERRDVSFNVIKHAVAKQFELMKGHQLFRIDLTGPQGELMDAAMRKAFTGDKLWETYLAAFPEGTNPVYKERTDHDCQCCKAFIRQMGGVVAIVDDKVVSIWDTWITGTFYDKVTGVMRELVQSAPIDNIFLHTEASVGTEKSFALDVDGLFKNTLTWEHFHLYLPATAVLHKDKIGPRLSDTKAAHDVLKRGLEELTLDAVDTVLELVAQNSLYRGEESKAVLTEFRRLKVAYIAVGPAEELALNGSEKKERRDFFVWSNIGSFAARIRNTAIGTLLIDLSAGTELEDAVKKFEGSIMAPANYKRPTALVSKAMIEKARVKIEELGYTSALERRYATIDDITVNNILFVDRAARPSMSKVFGMPYGKGKKFTGDDVFDVLAAKVPEKTAKLDKVEEITIDKFLADVLPKAESLEVMLENRHGGNLVSLIAPVDPGAKTMFKWPNNFSWSYAGDAADSIKERVKKAGGKVDGDLRCSLSWFNYDDLDLHMVEPGGNRIYYAAKQSYYTGGHLDVDMNAGGGHSGCGSRSAVENITYPDRKRMPEGTYKLMVNNYANVENADDGFEVEVEFDGVVHAFSYAKAQRSNETVAVANISFTRKGGFKVEPLLPASTSSKEVWSVQTNTFHKVNVVLLSPNFWDVDSTNSDIERSLRSGTGNKHYFFMLDGARNADKARGFYNEFLSNELEPHRKTMEMVGARMKTDNSERQLSGVGFSSTQRNSLMVRVQGKFGRVVKVVF
jgi:hypothetical protein